MSAVAAAAPHAPERRDTRHRPTLTALCLCATVYGLVQCLTIPAIPEISSAMGVSTGQASWVLVAFLISASVATPILGRLGDMYGKRRVLLAALAALCAGTALSAISARHGAAAARPSAAGCQRRVHPGRLRHRP